MKKNQIDQYNMLLTVETHFNMNELIWTSSVPISDTKAALTAKINEITIVATLQSDDSTGATMDKAAVRSDLEAKGFLVSQAVSVYASMHKGTKQEYKNVSFVKTDLPKLRGAELLLVIDKLYAAAAPIIEDLGVYGVTQATLTALLAANDAFRTIITVPVEVISSRKDATEAIPVLLREAIAILDNFMDKLMRLLRTEQPQFVNVYFNDRKIHNTGVHTLSLEILTLDASTNTPLAKVNIEVVGQGIKRISTEKGQNRVQNLKTGYYTLSASHPNFVSQMIPFTIISGETTQLVIEMQELIRNDQRIEVAEEVTKVQSTNPEASGAQEVVKIQSN